MLDAEMIPRYVMFRQRKCRVLDYLGDGRFEILDHHDIRRILHREWLTFIKEEK